MFKFLLWIFLKVLPVFLYFELVSTYYTTAENKKLVSFLCSFLNFGTGFYSCKYVIMHCTIHIIYTFFGYIPCNVCIAYTMHSASSILLVGTTTEYFQATKLPSRRDVLKVLFYYHTEGRHLKICSITVAHMGEDQNSN